MSGSQFSPFKGKWRIVEMDLWDREYLDMIDPAHITFQKQDRGEFSFGCVQASMTCSYGTETVFFTWEGADEMDPVDGEGFAELTESGTIEGEITLRNGDESGFKAKRM